jgi:serine/threonine protein kinase
MKFMKYEDTPMHLIGTIFQHDPNKRPTIEKILAHPWLNMKQKVKKSNKFLPFNKCYLLEKLNGAQSDVSDAEYLEIFDEKKKHDKRVEEKRKKKEGKDEKKEKKHISDKIYDAYLNLVSKKL